MIRGLRRSHEQRRTGAIPYRSSGQRTPLGQHSRMRNGRWGRARISVKIRAQVTIRYCHNSRTRYDFFVRLSSSCFIWSVDCPYILTHVEKHYALLLLLKSNIKSTNSLIDQCVLMKMDWILFKYVGCIWYVHMLAVFCFLTTMCR